MSEKNMTPEAAVEAALNARLTFKNQRGMDNAANQMRHILEAAAPHIRASALEEAADAWGYAAAAVWLRTRAARLRPTP